MLIFAEISHILNKIRKYSHCFFEVHVTMRCDKFLIINELDALISQIYFGRKTLQVLDSSSVYHQELSCQQTCMTYTTAVCTVKTPDDGQRNCPKHAEFSSKINLRNLCIYLVYYKKLFTFLYLRCRKFVEKVKTVIATRSPKSPIISPDLAPSDFHLFPTSKEFLGGRRFKIKKKVKDAVSSG